MSPTSPHIPLRTCISCGAKRAKGELIHLILDSHGVVIRDDDGKGRGRGAYVCPNSPCIEKLEKGNRLTRAFRKKGPVALHSDLERRE